MKNMLCSLLLLLVCHAAWAADDDDDGMPNDWELSYGLNPYDATDANLDPDGDTMVNLDEYRSGTDPQDSSSYLRLTSISRSGGDIVVQFDSTPGFSYGVQVKDSLADPYWTFLADVVVGTGSTVSIIDTASVLSRYYRVVTPGGGEAAVISANVLGCVNITVASGSNYITRPMLATADNTVEYLMPVVPDGSCIYKWNPAVQAYYVSCWYDALFAWEPPNLQILPGESFEFHNFGTPFTVTFLGEVIPAASQTVSVFAQGNGSVNLDPPGGTYPFGSVVTLTPVPARYHEFLRWSDDDTSNPRTITVGTSNSYTAIFTNSVPLEHLVFIAADQSFGGTNYDGALGAFRAGDGTMMLAGYSDSPPSGSKKSPHYGGFDGWAVRLLPNGEVDWDLSVGGTGRDIFLSALQTSDGGYLLGGSSASPPSGNKYSDLHGVSGPFGRGDGWLVRLDATFGEPVWDHSFGGSDNDYLTAHDVNDGEEGYILAGTSWSPPSGNKTNAAYGGADLWLVRVSGSGSKLWDKAFGGSGHDEGSSLAVLSDGGYVFAGASDSPPSGNKTSARIGSWDGWLLRLDASGKKLWEKAYGGTDEDWFYKVRPTSDGGFVLCGYTLSGPGGSKTSPAFGDYDLWVVRVDSAGNQLWERTYGGAELEYAGDIVEMPDGGFLVAGSSGSNVSGNKTASSMGADDGWLLRLDAAGNKIWEKSLGGADYDHLDRIALATDDTIILVGDSSSEPGGNKSAPHFGGSDVWMVTLNTRAAAPVGTPVILADGQFSANDSFTVTNQAAIEIQSTFPGAAIYFTLDGSDPDNGALYTGPFLVEQSAVVRAVAYTPDYLGAAEADPVTVTVLRSPVILSPPQSQSVIALAPFVFNVLADGDAPLSYQWRKNGINIPGATNASYTWPHALAADAGEYSVRVTNAYGAVISDGATLTVLQPPVVNDQPDSIGTGQGDSVEFCVGVAPGDGPFRYQWRKNGANIPGATNDCYQIDVVQVSDGGAYTVVVANDAGAVVSQPAVLTVFLGELLGGDAFTNRIQVETFGSLEGCFGGTNIGATFELNEPRHAGKPGGKSIWYTWQPDVDGIATFETVGSPFDTLLAVYTGSNVANLTLVAADEDGAGFLSSRVRFNAVAGREYQIAVDGYAGAEGRFIVCWTLQAAAPRLPVVTRHPASETVRAGESVTFTVAASNAVGNVGWYFNGAPLANRLGTTLTISNVLPANVGMYRAVFSNAFGGVVFTEAAVLEIGPVREIQSVDKLPDISLFTPPGFAAARGAAVASTTTGAGISVGAGTIDSQVINNTGSATSPNEPLPCYVIGGSSRWLLLLPATTATLRIDTIGSTIDTVLGVFRGDSPGDAVPFLCDDDSAPNGRSLIQFTAQAGRGYYIQADGKSGTNGIISIRWALGLAPTNLQPRVTYSMVQGDELTLVSGASGVPMPGLQWLRDSAPIVGATAGVLALHNIQPGDAGVYSVVASNALGVITNAVAVVTVRTNALAAADDHFDAPDSIWAGAAGLSNVVLQTLGGNPGGFIRIPGGAAEWQIAAPDEYLGNRFYCYNGLLSFDLRSSSAGLSGMFAVLQGAGRTLTLTLTPLRDTNWFSYKLLLNETTGWRNADATAVAREEFMAVLASLEGIFVGGGAIPAGGFVGFDNPSLLAPNIPLLSLRRDGGQWCIEWPEALGSFGVETNGSLGQEGWGRVLQAPTTTNRLNCIRLQSEGGQRFFRLSR